MSQNHGFNEPSNHRAKKFSQGKNSGPSGNNFHIPNIKPMPPSQPQVPQPLKTATIFQPQHDYILVELISRDVSEGGIFLPETAKKEDMAIVVAVGPGRVTEQGSMVKPCCQPGDRVFISPNPNSMLPVQIQGRMMLVINNMMIIGIYPKVEETKEEVQSTETAPA